MVKTRHAQPNWEVPCNESSYSKVIDIMESKKMNYEVFKTDEQWRQELSEFEYHVLRMAGTERAYTGELLEEKRSGSYHCRGCDAFLFESDTKFDSHCGWPSFYKPQGNEAIEYVEDRAHGMLRTEVRC